jgi:hypothetical protein
MNCIQDVLEKSCTLEEISEIRRKKKSTGGTEQRFMDLNTDSWLMGKLALASFRNWTPLESKIARDKGAGLKKTGVVWERAGRRRPIRRRMTAKVARSANATGRQLEGMRKCMTRQMDSEEDFISTQIAQVFDVLEDRLQTNLKQQF